jgi:hypothetical protein
MDISNACCFLRPGRMSWYRLATTALLPTCTAMDVNNSANRLTAGTFGLRPQTRDNVFEGEGQD